MKRKCAPLVVGFPALVLAAASLAIRPLPARPQSLDALYEKAKTEGALLLYTGGPTALYAYLKQLRAAAPSG